MTRKHFAVLGIAALLSLAGCGFHHNASYIPPGPTYAPPAPPGVLSAGTNLVVRTDTNINTNRAVEGEPIRLRSQTRCSMRKGKPLFLVDRQRN